MSYPADMEPIITAIDEAVEALPMLEAVAWLQILADEIDTRLASLQGVKKKK